MAKKPQQAQPASALRGKWANRILQATRDYQKFHESGKRVIDQYRIEENSRRTEQQDKYNILYSITETIKPSMYSQTPKPEVKRRHLDTTDPIAIGAAALLEGAIQYQIDDQDFDEVMRAAVEDLLLPGLGTVWLRYVPTLRTVAVTDAANNPVMEDDGVTPKTTDEVVYEHVALDYVHYRDFLSSRARNWAETWWCARRLYLTKQDMIDQGIDPAKAALVTFKTSSDKQVVASGETLPVEDQATVWEIWDKRGRQVIWLCDQYEDDVLKVASDFLKLEAFFPCPRPMRAVTTNNKWVPRPYFSQYQAQADELNDITQRIRKLAKALRVVGVYDQSTPALQNILTGVDNKMVPVDNWAMMQEKGGIKGTVDFLPIIDIATVLIQLYDARERVKNEIYDITGWSDIIRGVSKASETLGAQQLKANWASARLKLLQKDVERFVRDIFRLMGEIIAEHFGNDMLMGMAGITAEYLAQSPAIAQAFKQVVQTIRTDKDRCAIVGIESDSTLLPDEANDQQARMEFLSAAGAFLQQAVPAMEQYPPIAGLLGEMLVFAVRSFRSARPLEQAFEQFRQQIATNPPQAPQQQQQSGANDNGAGQAQAAQISAGVKQQDIQAKVQLGEQQNAIASHSNQTNAMLEAVKEKNRHDEKTAELALREREVNVREHELGIKSVQQSLDQSNTVAERALGEQARQEGRADAAQERQQEAIDAQDNREHDVKMQGLETARAISGHKELGGGESA